MSTTELEVRKRLKNNFEYYSANCLFIRTKEGHIEPFVLNKAQKYILSRIMEQKGLTGKIRAVILKGRQQGCSTLIEGLFYWWVTHSFGMRAFILTHEEEATNNLFDMAKRYHDNCPVAVKQETRSSNAKELIFSGLDSGYKLGTAGNKSVGRSSTIQYLHASEAAFYKHADEHAKGIMQTVPSAAGTAIFLESTANGVGNWFHSQWQMAESGQSDFIAIFVPWYWQDEYVKELPPDFKLTDSEIELRDTYALTAEQLCWRRMKIQELSVNGIDGEKAFKQEYPNNSTEAFQLSGEDSFIPPEIVMKARVKGRNNEVEPYGPLLIGVDPARFGDDRTTIIRRRGRCSYNLQTYIKKDTMQIAGLVHQIILEENPTKVFIDGGGLGGGVVDRLKELGYAKIIVEVNSGSKPLDEKRYHNKRAEMWGLGKAALMDENCSIPDDNSLHADLCGPKYRVHSNSSLIIESKMDMKARGIRSSDAADAWLLTFAQPVGQTDQDKAKLVKKQASILYATDRKVKGIKSAMAPKF